MAAASPRLSNAHLGTGKGKKTNPPYSDHSLEVICKQKLEPRACPGPRREAGGGAGENALFGKVFLIVSNNSS